MNTFYSMLSKVLSEKVIEYSNRITLYIAAIVVFGPHGAKECIAGVCNGPNFVVPMLMAFLMPNWEMDMSLRGWLLQILFSWPIALLLFAVFYCAKKKWGTILRFYVIRWTVVWYGVLLYFNVVFWYGVIRSIVFPLFLF